MNGFIGEWLLFQSLLHGAAIGSTAGDIALPLAVAALALTAGLTGVAFVKAVGIGFLGPSPLGGGRRSHRRTRHHAPGRRVAGGGVRRSRGRSPR